tara:strand:- start:38 stop:208 length:171 start_codon:yes stop_codon:yes gene_type:complete
MGKEIKKRGRLRGMRAIQLDLQEKLYNHPDNHKVIEVFIVLPLMIITRTKLLRRNC